MKEKIQAPQGARPVYMVTLVAILIAIIVAPLVFSGHKKSQKQTEQHVQTLAQEPAPVPASHPQQIAYVPASVKPADDIAPETRAALERAGLHDVQISSLALTVKSRKPVIVGSALPKSNQVTQ